MAGKLHTARSRNDQVAVDFRLFVRENIDEILELIHDLQKNLVKKLLSVPEIVKSEAKRQET